MSVTDLDAPLGKTKKSQRRTLPLSAPQLVAGVLAISVVAVGLWTVLGDDPLGGEPMAVVSTRALTKDQQVAAMTQSPERPGIDAKVLNGKASGPEAAIANSAAPPGSKIITVTDGTNGKTQQVVIPPKQGAPEQRKSFVDPQLLEKTRHGAAPKIGPNGERAAQVYARPVKPPPGKADAPQIAIIVGGLGIGASTTAEAMARLPGPVTFAFTPYAADLENLAANARGKDHELLLQAPMEPFDYPDNDPGPQTLLTTLTADQNIDRLQWLMSRMQGYVGMVSFMGARFTAADAALSPVMREIGKRGLLFIDDGASNRSVAGQIAGSGSLAFAKADVVLDRVPSPIEIDRALARLEGIARDKGSAVGIATASPAAVARIAEWTKKVESRGFLLVPISMVANKAKSS